MEKLDDILDQQRIPKNISRGDTGISSKEISTESSRGSQCPVCGGVGWVTPDVPFGHSDFAKAVPCNCIQVEWEAKAPERLEQYSNIGPLARLTFDTLPPRGRSPDEDNRRLFQAACEAAKRYAEEPRGWLVLTGNSGSGKTHLAAAIANHCIGLKVRTFFMVVPDLLDHLRSTFGPNSEVTYDELFEQVRNVPLLILDDLGAQSSSPWAAEKLFQVLNHRFNAQLPTVITTNVPLDRLDESLQSRLTDPELSTVMQVERRSSVLNAMDGLGMSIPAEMTFENFKPSGHGIKGSGTVSLEKAYDTALTFAEAPEGWLVLMGQPGRGKTHLAAAIANYSRQRGRECLFIQVDDLLDYLRSTYSPSTSTTYDEMFNKIRNVPLLVLDDYAEQTATPWAREKFYQIINHRYNARLPTVITTSLSLDEIAEEVDRRISSRMVDPTVATSYSIKAPDYRAPDFRDARRSQPMRNRR